MLRKIWGHVFVFAFIGACLYLYVLVDFMSLAWHAGRWHGLLIVSVPMLVTFTFGRVYEMLKFERELHAAGKERK